MYAYAMSLMISLFSNPETLSEKLRNAVKNNDFIKFEKVVDQADDQQLFDILNKQHHECEFWSLFKYAAIKSKDLRILKKIMLRFPILLEKKDDYGETLLHNLVHFADNSSPHNVTIQWLIEQGADVNNINQSGHSVIECDMAYAASKLSMLLLLLYGSKKKPRYYGNEHYLGAEYLLDDKKIDCAYELGQAINTLDLHKPSMKLLMQKIDFFYQQEILSYVNDTEMILLACLFSQQDRKNCLLAVELTKPFIRIEQNRLRAYAFTHFDTIYSEWVKRQY